MKNSLQIALLFLAYLGFGSAIVLPFFPVKITGKSFVQFYYGFIHILLGLFLWGLVRLDQFSGNYILMLSLGTWIWILSFLKTEHKIESYLQSVFSVFSLVLMSIYFEKTLFHGLEFIQILPRIILLILAAVFTAYHLMNMIFGHWYLVNRTLPIAELIRTCRIMIFITYARVASVIFATSFAKSQMTPDEFSRLLDFQGHGIFFWARVLAGLGIPLLVSHLGYQSAKIGSNQSATGIMYAGTVFVLMGEIMALSLYSITSLPF